MDQEAGTDATDVTLATPFGSRDVPAVAAGSNAYQSFSARAGDLSAGVAEATVGGADGTTVTAAYDGIDCA